MYRKFCGLTSSLILSTSIVSISYSSLANAASSGAKPLSPAITEISTSRAGKTSVFVKIALPENYRDTATLYSEIKVGSKICKTRGLARQCKVNDVSRNVRVAVSVRSKNKYGFSPWSSKVNFLVNYGTLWRLKDRLLTQPTVPSNTYPPSGTYPPTTTTIPKVSLPAPITNLNRARVLKTSSLKLAKIEGLTSVSGASVSSSTGVHKYAIGDVVFKSTGVVALAQAESAAMTGSKMLVVSSDGTTSEALANGSAVVKEFFNAPNGKYYVVFETKVALTSGSAEC